MTEGKAPRTAPSFATKDVVKETAAKIIALRKLSRESGCITTRTQSKLLQALNEEQLTAVAQILAQNSEASRG